MKAYIIATGALFGLITVAHVWRMFEERQLAREPWYVLITVAAAILTVWAGRLVSRSSRP